MNFELNFKPFGSNAILVEWEEKICPDILEDIIGFKLKIETNKEFPIQDIINCYNSLTIVYSYNHVNFSMAVAQLKAIYSEVKSGINLKPKLWHIPVCYDEDFGYDLRDFSNQKGLSINEIVNLHTQPIYKVYFIGFLPGFLYLGGLDKSLKISRKANPRLKVPKGSVAIGGNQTGIYPNDSAGGWNIIGRTPILFFDISKKDPCFAKSGDKIQFVSITKQDFKEIENRINNDRYYLKPVTND